MKTLKLRVRQQESSAMEIAKFLQEQGPGLVRISVGIEDLEELIADLQQAFQHFAG